MTTEETIALTRRTFVSKKKSLCFLIWQVGYSFFPGSKHLLISWLQSPSAVILEPKKRKSASVSIVSPSICCEMMRLDAMIFVFWMLSFKPAFSLSSFTFIKRLFSSLYPNLQQIISWTFATNNLSRPLPNPYSLGGWGRGLLIFLGTIVIEQKASACLQSLCFSFYSNLLFQHLSQLSRILVSRTWEREIFPPLFYTMYLTCLEFQVA